MCQAIEDMKLESELRGELRGELKGELRGELKGELRKAKEIAHSLLADGMGCEKAAKHTGLVLADVKRLAEVCPK